MEKKIEDFAKGTEIVSREDISKIVESNAGVEEIISELKRQLAGKKVYLNLAEDSQTQKNLQDAPFPVLKFTKVGDSEPYKIVVYVKVRTKDNRETAMKVDLDEIK